MSILKGSNLILNSVLRRKTLIPSVFQLDRYNHTTMSEIITKLNYGEMGIPIVSERTHQQFIKPLKDPLPEIPQIILQQIIKSLKDLGDPFDFRPAAAFMKKIRLHSDTLPPLNDVFKTSDNKVDLLHEEVCWIEAYLDLFDNRVWFQADSNSYVYKGFASIFCKGLSGRHVTELPPDLFYMLYQTIDSELAPLTAIYDLYNMLQLMQKKSLYLASDYIMRKEGLARIRGNIKLSPVELELKALALERQELDMIELAEEEATARILAVVSDCIKDKTSAEIINMVYDWLEVDEADRKQWLVDNPIQTKRGEPASSHTDSD